MTLKNFVLKVFMLRVHCWGGLGSQIFACIIARRLSVIFPNRTVALIFHSSGVTRRVVEISPEFTSDFVVIAKDDFRHEKKLETKLEARPSPKLNMKLWTVYLFEKFGFLARLNSEHEFLQLMPNLFQVRGHYTQIVLSSEEVIWIAKCLRISVPACGKPPLTNPILHLRLGDLLKLESKSHIELDRLSEIVRRVSNNGTVTVFSDSEPLEVRKVIQTFFTGIEYEIRSAEAINLIREATLCETFIGTNSKLTLWIAIIRVGLNFGALTVLPREVHKQLDILLHDFTKSDKMIEY